MIGTERTDLLAKIAAAERRLKLLQVVFETGGAEAFAIRRRLSLESVEQWVRGTRHCPDGVL